MKDNVRTLTCSCCGATCRGRQWHNRDTGYGLCSDCVVWIRQRGKETPEEFTRCYGTEGVHFNVQEVQQNATMPHAAA